ncbi:uncharacterized protein E5676_scaffold600G002150 [Cucumis melo var. makuwa]|uniref:Uncharacterized protein n=1 Tax=Cucumis melo var. makuwa TaxID=1194695 RepID=A0A5D3DXE5_CUCMM|nr:uncharacterized protein E6C27_scaffold61G002090 [Cucumis melo var. makuwa]TYK28373.1 uncharacterized protein E5676_scaffold600G002150 [Cucumis melo var. makuwa]
MTIMKYEQKFTKLEKYVIFFMLDDEEKYEHFEEGLRTTIRVPVMTSMSDWISSRHPARKDVKRERRCEEKHHGGKKKDDVEIRLELFSIARVLKVSKAQERKRCEETSERVASFTRRLCVILRRDFEFKPYDDDEMLLPSNDEINYEDVNEEHSGLVHEMKMNEERDRIA